MPRFSLVIVALAVASRAVAAAPVGNVTIQTFKSRTCDRSLGARNASFPFGACRPLGRHFLVVRPCGAGNTVLYATFHASSDCSDAGVDWQVPTDGSCYDTGEEGINLPLGCYGPPVPSPTPTPPAASVQLSVYSSKTAGCYGPQFTPTFNVTRECSLAALGPALNFVFARFVSCTSAGPAPGTLTLGVWPYASRGCGNESVATYLTVPTGCSLWTASGAYVNASCLPGQPNVTSASATPSPSRRPPPPAGATGQLAVFYGANSTGAPACGGAPSGVWTMSQTACTPIWLGGVISYGARLLSCYAAVRFASYDDCVAAGNGTVGGVVVPLSPGACVSSLIGSYNFTCSPGGGWNDTALAAAAAAAEAPTAVAPPAQLAAAALVGATVGGALVAGAVLLALRRRRAATLGAASHGGVEAVASSTPLLAAAARWGE